MKIQPEPEKNEKNKLIDKVTLIDFFSSKVQAGFPSQIYDEQAQKLDLNKLLIDHPISSFLVRVAGDSMINAGILENDILVVDRSLVPSDGKIVIAVLEGEMTVKRIRMKNNIVRLVAENPDYPEIVISDQREMIIWGLVVGVVRKY